MHGFVSSAREVCVGEAAAKGERASVAGGGAAQLFSASDGIEAEDCVEYLQDWSICSCV